MARLHYTTVNLRSHPNSYTESITLHMTFLTQRSFSAFGHWHVALFNRHVTGLFTPCHHVVKQDTLGYMTMVTINNLGYKETLQGTI